MQQVRRHQVDQGHHRQGDGQVQGLRLRRLQEPQRRTARSQRDEEREEGRPVGQAARTGSHQFVLCQLASGRGREDAERHAQEQVQRQCDLDAHNARASRQLEGRRVRPRRRPQGLRDDHPGAQWKALSR